MWREQDQSVRNLWLEDDGAGGADNPHFGIYLEERTDLWDHPGTKCLKTQKLSVGLFLGPMNRFVLTDIIALFLLTIVLYAKGGLS